MEEERIQFLQEAIKNNPDDTFIRYALAMEFAKAGRPDEAWKNFEYLLERHPDYSATYYQAGALLAREGRLEEARQILTRGIEVARRQGNTHAAGELEAALDEVSH